MGESDKEMTKLELNHDLKLVLMPSITQVEELSVAERDAKILRYLSLPADNEPSPSKDPIGFLKQYISILPPSLLQLCFSDVLTPLERSKIPAIRNRRLDYHSSAPAQLSFPVARNKWVTLWDEVAPAGAVLREDWRDQAKEGRRDEETWAESNFLAGKTLAGERNRLGKLLGGYEEERELEGSDEEEEEMDDQDVVGGERGWNSGDNEQLRRVFERVLKERLIDGLLENFDYDAVDWDSRWDKQSRDDEERWFDEDDED
ncbi:SubName: Full=Uncharacterized protein {ECO:0000313/EMBL:CCA66532.1} [Serendipita indica DSM 11827]|nr:SubName: Full=Uncharacterized protein {ECO:0000313/EMBL:CCA66532.1} [Serendipita indica DSM 11827]